jgi:hypothetical protein
MSMSDAYTECEERGIPTDAPDALQHLWTALSPTERREIFPFATNYDAPAFDAPPTDAVPGGYVLTEPAAGQWRMWNGTAQLRFQLVHETARNLERGYRIRYTGGETAFAPTGELREASHEVMAPHVAPVQGRLTFPPADNAARARELAAEHIRRARLRLDSGVPSGGRPWRPGDTPRAAVLHEAADVLARLAAVYLGAESPRNQAEARAYALAFRLVETSARRLAMRRLR